MTLCLFHVTLGIVVLSVAKAVGKSLYTMSRGTSNAVRFLSVSVSGGSYSSQVQGEAQVDPAGSYDEETAGRREGKLAGT